MGTQKEFDEIMREKLEGLEADPPAHVWAAIQAEVGTAEKGRKPGAWWLLGVAAAVALLVGAAWLFWPGRVQEAGQSSMARRDIPTAPSPDARDQAPDTQPQVPQEQHTGATPAVPHQPRQQSPAPVHAPAPQQPGTLAEQPAPGRDSLEMQRGLPQDEPTFFVEEQPAPAPLPLPSQPQEEMEAQPTYAQMAQPAKVSKGVLGAVTKGARDVLGVDAHYYEQATASAKTTTFSADLGFIKVSRVKKTKVQP